MSYDSSLKEWRGTRFKEKEKFILKTQFVRTESFGNQTIEFYNVTVTLEGRESQEDCYAQMYGEPGDPRDVGAFSNTKVLNCSTLSRTYKFNLKTSRFLSAYVEGYVNGDNNNDTPAFAAGKCTKIGSAH